MKKLLIVLMALCMALPLAACGNETPPPAETEYTITAADGADYSVDAPDTAKAGETVTVTVTSKSVLKTVAEVKANDTACTAGGDGTYTFTMPAENVTIAVTMQPVQTEIPSDDVLSWRANAPGTIAKAQEGDTWAEESFYFDFSRETHLDDEVTVTSLNEDVIPADAIESVRTEDGSSSYYTVYGYFVVDLSKVSLGTAYIAVQADDMTIIKRVDVVEYGTIEYETWNVSVTFDLSEVFGEGYTGMYIRISDSDAQYGVKESFYVERAIDESTDEETITISVEYVPGHNYSVAVFYYDEQISNAAFPILDAVGTGIVPDVATFDNPYLTFTAEGQSITLTPQLPEN